MNLFEHASEVLDQAAEYVETYGLHQGTFYPGSDGGEWWSRGAPTCALGAVASAEHGFEQWQSKTDWLVENTHAVWALAELFDGESVADFNDAPGRTAAEVAQVLRDAATKVRPDAMVVSG